MPLSLISVSAETVNLIGNLSTREGANRHNTELFCALPTNALIGLCNYKHPERIGVILI